MKIRPVGAEIVPCGQTDRQTDITTLIVAFRNFANAPKKGRADGRGYAEETQKELFQGEVWNNWRWSVLWSTFYVLRRGRFSSK